MKKSLLAVAVLGALSGAAFAQVAPNNITLYGIVDAGLQSTKTTTRASATAAEVSGTVTGLNSGIQSGSRWGLRGSEDLGGGLKGNFQLESGFNLDNGTSAQGGRLFGRAAWLGLSGGFGEVRLGRMAIFSGASVTGIADPFGNGFSNAGWQYLSTAAAPQRNDNTVTYLTPNMGGLQGGLYYTFGEVATPVAATTAKNNWIGGGVTYSAGPLALGVAYDTVDSSTTTTRDAKWLNLAASYDFGFATLRAGYVDQEEANRTDRTGYILGANVPLGGGVLLASYQDGEDKLAGAKTDYTRLSLGYTYSLSKRTNVYTAFTDGKAKAAGYTANKERAFSLGVRHSF
jgi:predicted porin